MKILYTEKEYQDAGATTGLLCECYNCKKEFKITKKLITHELKNLRGRCKFCTLECNKQYKTTKVNVQCKNCSNHFLKFANAAIKSPNHFCTKSCAATYNNKNKTTGTRRSKLEIWLETTLTELFPILLIDFNKKDTIGSELDIYFPTLKLAIELNGIFHYEPIYGADKLNQIQNNDVNKFQKCQELGISLCIIDTSGQKYFKESTSIKYLDIIKNLVTSKLVCS